MAGPGVLGMRQWARFTPEADWGVYNASADPTTIVYPTLQNGAALQFPDNPQKHVERAAHGGNLRMSMYGHRKAYSGQFQCLLRPIQAAKLIPWAFDPDPDLDQLPSMTIDWWDGVKANRFLGCVVGQAQISSNDSDDAVMLSYTNIMVHKRDDTFTTFPKPPSTVYATGRPYEHRDSKGLVTLGMTVGPPPAPIVQIGYKTLTVTARNILAAHFAEDDFLLTCKYAGRDLDFAMRLIKRSDALRAAFENSTVQPAGKIKWAVSAAEYGSDRSLEFNFQNASYVTADETTRDFEDVQFDNATFGAFLDNVTGKDGEFTVV